MRIIRYARTINLIRVISYDVTAWYQKRLPASIRYIQGRRNERKSGPANAYVSRGGVWGGARAFFFLVLFCTIWCKICMTILLRIDENRSDQCVNARTIYSKCHISNLTNSLKHDCMKQGIEHHFSLCEHVELAGRLSHL